MDQRTSALLGALAGGVLVGAIAFGVRDDSVLPADPSAPAAVVPAESTPPDRANVDLSPVLTRLDGIDGRLRAIEQQVDALASAPARTVSASGASPAAVAIDADSLQQALEQVERKKLDAMGDDELLRAARLMAKAEADPRSAVRMLRALLERPLSPEKRAEALVDLGMQLRAQKTTESLAASVQALQQVVDTNGLGSDVGRSAAFQLIWTFADQKDAARGITMAQAYAEAPDATPRQRFDGRWAAAILVHGTGDTVRARREYEALLRDLGEQPEYAKLAADIRQRLGKL